MRPEPSTLVAAGLVAAPLAASALSELAAWGLALGSEALVGGWYGRGDLLATVHLLTVGTLWSAILGVSWQLIPVVGARPWPAWALRLAPGVIVAWVLALPVFALGFVRPGPGVAVAAALLLAAAATHAGAVLAYLAGPMPPGRRALRLWLGGAQLTLFAGIALGFTLYLARAGLWRVSDPVALLRLHATWLFAGATGGWIIGAGSLLIPMFAVAPEPSERRSGLGAVLWFAGAAATFLPLMLLGAALAAADLVLAIRRGLRPGFGQAALALGALPAAIGLAAFGEAEAAVVLGLGGVALPLLHAVSRRIVPFFAWMHAWKDRAAPVAPELYPPGLARAQAGLGFVGAALLLWTRLAEPDAAPFAAGLLASAALFHLAGLGVATWRAFAARRAAEARFWAGGT